MCSLHTMCTWCTNCAPGARVCSSKGSCFKPSAFCTLCAHSCTQCTKIHKNIFDEHTYFFLHQLPLHLAGDSRTGGGRSPTRAPSCFISRNRNLSFTVTVYIVPIQNILGRLALAPYGEHGTIPHEWHHLQGSHYPRGVCDSPNRPGSGSKLFYINSWAMIWSSDHPRVATKAK